MSATICIYCKRSDVETTFQGREHVIPQAFGTFEPDNLTLTCVCDDCNGSLGKELDQPLARDSAEGWQRQFFGRWPTERRKQKRVKMLSKEEGLTKGMVLEMKRGPDDAPICFAPSQVGVFNVKKSQYEYFAHNALPVKEVLLNQYDLKDHFVDIRPASEDTEASLIEWFTERELKIELVEKGALQESNEQILIERALIETTVVLDATIMRALSKIAFNYLAAIVGASFVLHDNFDYMREFIRWGKHQTERGKFFFVNQPPIIIEERIARKFGIRDKVMYVGHIVTIGWKNRDAIVAQVTLYNNQIYKIILCKQFSGIWRDIKSGHFFDFKERRIISLKSDPSEGIIPKVLGMLRVANLDGVRRRHVYPPS